MVLRIVGRVFIAAGILILLFLGYELFGTRFVTDRAQRALASSIDVSIRGPAPAKPAKPDLGDGIARIQIPKIEVNWVVVEGVGTEALKKGPGHFPGTPFPGEQGNVVISGHRNIYGSPFWRLDEVGPGDTIKMLTPAGTFAYKVTETKIVEPTDLSVIVPAPGEFRLTLTTCHPKLGAKKRLIVVAQMVASEVKNVV